MKLIRKFYSENRLGRIFILYIPSMLISILGMFIVLDNFQTPSIDTTNLTNYGFAILVGLSSVCFSWARNMDKNVEPEMLDKVTVAAEKSLHSAILFLIASGIKYSLLSLKDYFSETSTLYSILHIALYSVFLPCFVIAFIKFESVLRSLNFTLYERLNQNKKT